MERLPDQPSPRSLEGRCVACGQSLEGGGCCSGACAAAAERELKQNVGRLQRRIDSDERRRLAERNGRLSSALMRWRPGVAATSETASLPQGMGELVLIVDDEPAIRTLAQRALETFGYRVVTAADGAEALELFELHHGELALVVVDLMMPVMDGYETIRSIRREDDDVAIIAASGANTPEARDRSLAEGATRFLAKPYPAHTLLRMLADILSRRQERDSAGRA